MRANIHFSLPAFSLGLWLAATAAVAVPPAGVSNSAPAGSSTNLTSQQTSEADRSAGAPESPREWLNAGTRHLNQGKLREAEVCLENALHTQSEKIQPAALYNAGHVRFRQGLEELRKGPASSTALSQGQQADEWGGQAVRAAEAALESNIIPQMVQAYLRGRGTRRELKRATEAVKQALQAHSAALLKWQRASGDFHSAVELDPADKDAQHNADVVDRHIARLVDTIRQIQQLASALGKQAEELREKMKQLKGKIPQEEMPPGAAGDEEEDEEEGQKMPEEGQQEAKPKEGIEIQLTPEQAAWFLESLRLDRERRLPMGMDKERPGSPKDRNRPDW